MRNLLLYTLPLLTSSLTASPPSIEFVEYHLKAAIMGIEDDDAYNLIQEDINNLKNLAVSDHFRDELISLIEDGYTIDPFSMSKLIETLSFKDASNNAKTVIISAIEHDAVITPDHLFNLIQTLTNADATNNAAEVLIEALKHGAKFGSKEALRFFEISSNVNAKNNVIKIRKAIQEKLAATQ